jgi:hypothetical protein
LEKTRARFGKKEKKKMRGAEEGRPPYSPMDKEETSMAGDVVCPVSSDEAPIATRVNCRPLHSRPTPNET